MADPTDDGDDATAIDTATAIDIGEIGYAEALAELEAILGDLEDEAIDIDVLAEQVARASALIQFCRQRISSARVQVDRIVAELEQTADEHGQTSLL
jgi:exodeoxyribonuclease VII small subunit